MTKNTLDYLQAQFLFDCSRFECNEKNVKTQELHKLSDIFCKNKTKIFFFKFLNIFSFRFTFPFWLHISPYLLIDSTRLWMYADVNCLCLRGKYDTKMQLCMVQLSELIFNGIKSTYFLSVGL